ncbi:oxidoreductase [Belliella kenyensis]|uniref:Oxidoreductase n=1 Tax=Belliella kenyensis TaxID=1472724 RepID=A0ABV8EKG1_9BACT|nr:oxidoreductase [Belliella kenyensis]MCH7400508.1 oxidoreductase [Belliella kenyensis]MDN3604476.1 oxidoreductase [Belliella kenyensis]
MKKIAIISGTSGLIGMQLMHQLIQHPEYAHVLSIGRRKLALKHEKLIQIAGDMNNMREWDLEMMLRKEDIGGILFPFVDAINNRLFEIHAFCSLGTTIKQAGSKEQFYKVDHDFVINYAEFVKKLGAKKFLYVSALGADPTSNIFYNQVKGETEEDLKVLSFGYLGIFQPSLLMGSRSEFRFGEEVAKIVMKPLIWLKLLKKIRPIYDHQVAKSMIDYAVNENHLRVEVIPSGTMQELTQKV